MENLYVLHRHCLLDAHIIEIDQHFRWGFYLQYFRAEVGFVLCRIYSAQCVFIPIIARFGEIGIIELLHRRYQFCVRLFMFRLCNVDAVWCDYPLNTHFHFKRIFRRLIFHRFIIILRIVIRNTKVFRSIVGFFQWRKVNKRSWFLR